MDYWKENNFQIVEYLKWIIENTNIDLINKLITACP